MAVGHGFQGFVKPRFRDGHHRLVVENLDFTDFPAIHPGFARDGRHDVVGGDPLVPADVDADFPIAAGRAGREARTIGRRFDFLQPLAFLAVMELQRGGSHGRGIVPLLDQLLHQCREGGGFLLRQQFLQFGDMQPLLSHPDILGFGDIRPGDRGLDHPADLHKLADLPPAAADGDRLARFPGPAGAADPVDIILAALRDVVVDHIIDAGDVDAPGGHVGGHQNAGAPVLEALHHLGALGLLHIAVQPFGHKAVAVEISGDFIHHPLGVAENHGQLRVLVPQYQVESVHLAAHGYVDIHLLDVFHRLLPHLDLHQDRILLIGPGQGQDGRRHGGGEENGLSVLRGVGENGLDILPEAHAEHFVRLVQHNHFQAIQLQGAPPHVIHHPAGGAYHQVGGFQPQDLPIHRRAAVDLRRLDAGQEPGQLADFPAGLHRQLPGGAKDQHLTAAAHGGVDDFQRRDAEGQRLAGAGLGPADDIPAALDKGNALGLNVGGGFEAQGLHRPADFGD